MTRTVDSLVRMANTAANLGHTRDALRHLASAIETSHPNDISIIAMLDILAANSPTRSSRMHNSVNDATNGRFIAQSSYTE